MNSSPLNNIFYLTNRDPNNYVLYKDIFIYSILGIYLFLFWYLISVLENYDTLILNEAGEAAWYITLLTSIGFGILFLAVFLVLKIIIHIRWRD